MSKRVFLIAGEASGDVLGGALMRDLKAAGDIEFTGVGGQDMQAQGLQSLLPMEELCVMGIAEVLGHLPRLLKLMSAMCEEVEAYNPDILVTIDLPDFNFRVAKMLKKRGVFKGKIVHYVAPTVWAWRPGRAKKIAAFLDGLMCLFPFEPDYFTEHGLKAAFVGHSLAERELADDGAAFRAKHGVAADVPLVGLFFGSRESELKIHKDVFLEAISMIAEQAPDVQLVVPTMPALHFDVTQALQGAGVPAVITLDAEEKWQAMAAMDAAIAVSGTVGLELSYAGVPHVIGYKASWITWVLLKILVKTKFAHLGNILLDRGIVPEYLQIDCVADKIAGGVLKLLKSDEAKAAQKEAFTGLRAQLQGEKSAADFARDFF